MARKADQQEKTSLTEETRQLVQSVVKYAKSRSSQVLKFRSDGGNGDTYSRDIADLTEAGAMKLAAQELGRGAMFAP